MLRFTKNIANNWSVFYVNEENNDIWENMVMICILKKICQTAPGSVNRLESPKDIPWSKCQTPTIIYLQKGRSGNEIHVGELFYSTHMFIVSNIICRPPSRLASPLNAPIFGIFIFPVVHVLLSFWQLFVPSLLYSSFLKDSHTYLNFCFSLSGKISKSTMRYLKIIYKIFISSIINSESFLNVSNRKNIT